MPIALVILAAGQGTRMVSDLPKVMHHLAGVPMLHHAMTAARSLEAERTVVVAGFGADQVREAALEFDPDAIIAVQEQQLGTGHAVGAAAAVLADFSGDVIVLYGDTPFVSTGTLKTMLAARTDGADVVVLGFEPEVPDGYGRLVTDADGRLLKIVEYKDASPEQLQIGLCNSGVIVADARVLFDLVGKIANDNTAEEYYLTDIVGLANAAGQKCVAVTCPPAEVFGINSRAQLAAAEQVFQANARHDALENGVTLQAPDSVIFAFDTMISRDVILGPNVVFGPGVTIETGAEIRAFSHLEGCHIGEGVTIGPFARLRPGAEIGDFARIGNFVEIKEAQVGEAAKINHLSYVGNATIGKGANIGAGTITCNYDGVLKHHTEIGAGAFIGSNSSLVAPVSIGANAMIGSGSVISKDVPAEALGISRPKQEIILGFATKLMARLTARKAAQKTSGSGQD